MRSVPTIRRQPDLEPEIVPKACQKHLYTPVNNSVSKGEPDTLMCKSASLFFGAGLIAILATGCSGPAYKLGRGLNNMTEVTRMGELRRSMEEANLWEGPDAAMSFGAIQGVTRTIGRTLVGAVEVATFPIPTPTYDPIYNTDGMESDEDVYIGGPYRPDQLFSLDYLTKNPRYPANFKPGPLADTMFATDTALGFAAGDVAPFVPGSRFHVFDY